MSRLSELPACELRGQNVDSSHSVLEGLALSMWSAGICEHGTVQVIGRRQIEMYSRLIHTVDHVEGYLRSQLETFNIA